jgi:hypothetical protein
LQPTTRKSTHGKTGTSRPEKRANYRTDCGVGVVCLLVLSGIITPLVLRSNRQARFRKRMQVESPCVYSGPMGMCHEADGYTSLDRLGGVDYIPSDSAITFQVYHRSERYGAFRLPVSVEVQRRREADAEALANRFIRSGVWSKAGGCPGKRYYLSPV